MSAIGRHTVISLLAIGLSGPALASSLVIDGLNGVGSSETVTPTSNETLWDLVGTVTTPSNKNAILDYYVIATGSSGTSVFSLGELDPSFGGTNIAPYIGTSGGQYSLIDPNPGASGRGVTDLTTLRIVAAPSLLSTTPGGQSTSVTVTGGSNPGNYTLTGLQNFASSHGGPIQVTPPGSPTYTGISLDTLLGLSTLANLTSYIVITEGTDGYEVVLSAAELDSAFGGNPNNILAYASTGTDFTTSGDGVARTILPTDNKHGRWESNLAAIELVNTTPLPPTWAMMLTGLAGLCFVGYRQSKKTISPATA